MRNITANWNQSRSRVVAMLLFVAIFGFALGPSARADEWNKKTIVTFSGPVEIPGKVLTPGTYVFKLLNSASNRNIVQVFDEEEKNLQATILAIPDYRLQPSDKPLIRFEERPAGTPEAIKAWFYPGDVYGQQFVYPQTRAVELAKQTHENVLSMPNEMTGNITSPATSATEPSVQVMQNTNVNAVNPTGEQIELAQAVSNAVEDAKNEAKPAKAPAAQNAEPAVSTSANTPESSAARESAASEPAAVVPPEELPKTGSPLPLISLLGTGSLGAAMILHFSRRAL